jgi:hypothetical protein
MTLHPEKPMHAAVISIVAFQFADLLSFHDPADQCSCGETYGKRRGDSQNQVSLDALSCVIQEFFGSIAALFRSAPRHSHAFLNCVSDRAGCARSLVS